MHAGHQKADQPVSRETLLFLASLASTHDFQCQCACRRDAPPGFRAAPRAVFVVTPFSFNPSRLPPGNNPVVRCLAPLDVTEPVAPGRSNQSCVAASRSLRIRRNSLRQVVQKRAVLNAGGSCPSRHERQVTDNTHGLAIGFHTAPQDQLHKVRHGHSRLSSGGRLARISGRAGAAFMRGCRAGHISFRSGSAQGVLVLS